jgi:hypothetical protein
MISRIVYSPIVASHLGWQAVCRLIRHAATLGGYPGVMNPDCVSGRLSGQATLCLSHYLLKRRSGKATRAGISVAATSTDEFEDVAATLLDMRPQDLIDPRLPARSRSPKCFHNLRG